MRVSVGSGSLDQERWKRAGGRPAHHCRRNRCWARNFCDVVRHQHRDTTWPAVLVRGGRCLPQIRLGDHVVDGVVDENRIEAPLDGASAYSTQVVTIRIERRDTVSISSDRSTRVISNSF